MRRFAVVVVAGIAFVLGGAQGACVAAPLEEPPPAAATADEEAEALRLETEAAAARERAEKAAEDLRVAEEKALRGRRRVLEKELALAEEAVDAARASGDDVAKGRAASEVRRVSAALAAFLAKNAGAVPAAPRPVAPVMGARPGIPFSPAEGLPPLRPADRPFDDAVTAALDWLKRHQAADGSWKGSGFDVVCRDGKCPGTGGSLHDVGLTGLASLAFLGAGETHKTPRHGEDVRDALKHLKGIQDPEGCFGPRATAHFTYDHAIAALAMNEAYGMTQSPLFKGSAEAGTRFILSAQNPYLGWRYGVKPGDNDTSVTGWMVLALASARGAGIFVPEESFQGALAWIEKVTEPEYGRAGYTARGNGPARPQELMDRFPAERSEALTAIAVTTRMLCGQGPENPLLVKGLELLDRMPPAWDDKGSIDFVYWFFGTLAAIRADGDRWGRWWPALASALGPMQRGAGDGCACGSWDPVDPWGDEGGRVYSTAINALSLEAGYRYPRAARAK